jgi:hypothetical protein
MAHFTSAVGASKKKDAALPALKGLFVINTGIEGGKDSERRAGSEPGQTEERTFGMNIRALRQTHM